MSTTTAKPERIPWQTIGEKISPRDLLEVIRFLLPDTGADSARYAEKAQAVEDALAGLAAAAGLPSQLTLGENVRQLEAHCRERFGVKHACFLTNATAGFEIAHQLIGLKPGDEVIVPAITFISTMAYPLTIGAKIVIADVDPRTLNLDPADVARKITPKTRAIIPVHLGGYPVDMDPILELADKHGIIVIEDAAHAIGGSYKGRQLGTLGDFGAFSFHQVKNMTSFGEGGLLVSNHPAAAQFARARFLGIDYSKPVSGWLYDVPGVRAISGETVQPGNHSSTEIQAIGLRCQLRRLPDILAQRRAAAAYLTGRLEKITGLRPQRLDTPELQGTYMIYQLQIDPETAGGDIQALKAKLAERGIKQIQHYVPLYHYTVLKEMGYDTDAIRASCPVAEDAYWRRFTHLPLANLKPADLEYMADNIIEAMRELRG